MSFKQIGGGIGIGIATGLIYMTMMGNAKALGITAIVALFVLLIWILFKRG